MQFFKSALTAARKNYIHILCMLITLGFLAMTLCCFQNSLIRIIEAGRDFGLSFAFCFNPDISPTVNDLSEVGLQDLGLIPQNIDLFIVKLRLYGRTLISGDTILDYALIVANGSFNTLYIISIGLLPAVVFVFLAWVMLKRKNNDYNQDTKPLKVVKAVSAVTYLPVKRWLYSFFGFIKENGVYWKIWAVIWAFNFNAGAIMLEILAYYLYFIGSADLLHLYVQAYKLLLDLSVVIRFIPVWLWIIIALFIFCKWRDYHSYAALEKLEEKDEEHVQNLPIASLICGPMGTKKTTFLSDIAITANKLFRDTAYKKLFENDMKFPAFPWINLERCVLYGIEHHSIYNLETCSKFINVLKTIDERGRKYPNLLGAFKNGLSRNYGYAYNNMLFDYDVDRYGVIYDDHLELQTLYDVLETYTKLYFIYVISCTLLYANYSIRADGILQSEGNFPLWDIDFFRRDTKLSMQNSRRAHILDFDMCRLGKIVLQDNRFKDSLDFGIIVITEVGKERGNQYTVAAHKLITAELGIAANQDNDLLNVDVKLCRARATVDNIPFVLWLMDEQRAASLGADFKEVCDLVYISSSTDFKITSPLYALDELIYLQAYNIFFKFYSQDRFNKGGNSLLRHTLKCIFNVIYQHHISIFNRFAVSTLSFTVQDGRMEDKAKNGKYPLMKQKIHASVFATDAWAAYYHAKHSQSQYGILDVPEYIGKYATIDEIAQQHSYFDMDCRGTIAKK